MLRYSALYLISFLFSKFLGLDRTVRFFRWGGSLLQPWLNHTRAEDLIELELKQALEKVPLAAKCLDQAIVTWTVLNFHRYPAHLKIGLSITPLESHAWVVVRDRIFVDSYNLVDLTVVADYGPWPQNLTTPIEDRTPNSEEK